MGIQQKPMTEEKAFQRLAALCSRGERSSGDMERKMREWRMTEPVRSRVLQRLAEGKYVDDERFCRAFVHDKIEFDLWGRRKIEAALSQKGISSGVYTPILDSIDESVYIDKLSKLIAGKRRTMSCADRREAEMRLVRFAIARGFAYHEIKEVLNQYIDGVSLGDDE